MTSYRDRQLVPHKKDKSGNKVKAKKTQKQGWILSRKKKEQKYDRAKTTATFYLTMMSTTATKAL